jgi:hypothetical protein
MSTSGKRNQWDFGKEDTKREREHLKWLQKEESKYNET